MDHQVKSIWDVIEVITIWDLFLPPLYLVIIYLIAFQIKAKYIKTKPEYKYFVKGLTVKLAGSIAFVLIYIYYYGGGDTINYYKSSVAVVNMFFEDPSAGLSVITNHLTPENHSKFNTNTGWPSWYMWKENNTFSVVRFTTFFTFIGSKSFVVTSLLTACFSYIGVWKLFQLFHKLYPSYIKVISIAVLFIPSFAFWGSGIMKDTYAVGASCWATYNFYKIFIERKNIQLNVLFLFLNFFIILNVKPYVIACLLPSMLFWINQAYIRKIKSALFRVILLPFILLVFSIAGYFVFSNVSKSMGEYGDVDSAIEKAKVTQQDLLREEQYGSNSYDLGEIDGSITGLLKIAPIAIFTAIYRPAITEIGSPTMFLAVLENTILLILTLRILFKTKITILNQLLKENPLILYSLVFSIILGFGSGIASANFGALVRYKIPLIPFYFSTLFLIQKITEKHRQIRKQEFLA